MQGRQQTVVTVGRAEENMWAPPVRLVSFKSTKKGGTLKRRQTHLIGRIRVCPPLAKPGASGSGPIIMATTLGIGLKFVQALLVAWVLEKRPATRDMRSMRSLAVADRFRWPVRLMKRSTMPHWLIVNRLRCRRPLANGPQSAVPK